MKSPVPGIGRFVLTPQLLLLLLLEVLLVDGGFAQSITGGEVFGSVLDQRGAAVPVAVVTVRDMGTGIAHAVTTPFSGRFHFSFLTPGDYEVVVEALNFRPRRLRGVPVRPGQAIELEVRLRGADVGVVRVDTIPFESAAFGGTRAGMGHRFEELELQRLPDRAREVTELTSLATEITRGLAAEGLPGYLSAVAMDGMLSRPARHPGLADDPFAGVSFTRGSLSSMEVLFSDPDVEWQGAAGSYFAGVPRGGTNRTGVTLFADYAGGGLWSSDYFDGAVPSSSSFRGGLAASLPVRPDTTHVAVGIEGWRVQRPRAAYPGDNELAAAFEEAAPYLGEALLGPMTEAGVDEHTVFTAFADVDAMLGSQARAGAHANFATFSATDPVPTGLFPSSGALQAASGMDVSAAAYVGSKLFNRWGVEVRAGFEHSSRDFGASEFRDPDTGSRLILGNTGVADRGTIYGTYPGLPARISRTNIQAQAAIHWRLGNHSLKGGGTVYVPFHDYDYGFGSSGEFHFSDPSDLEGGGGLYTGFESRRPSTDFSAPRLGFFVQDAWDALPGFRLFLGLRGDAELLPAEDVRLNQRWLELTGMRNDDLESTQWQFSPRGGFRWDIAGRNRTIVRGAVGVYFDETDPTLLHEVLGFARGLSVRRVVGGLQNWPVPPVSAAEGATASRLTLLGPSMRAPGTVKGSLGISQRVAQRTALTVAGSYRYTQLLPRRSDLNRLPNPVYRDQFGRSIYGPLSREGELVFATPGKNRRFPEFDHVWGVDPDGWSRYVGFTVGLERRGDERLDFFASYTFSRTEDNWTGAASADPGAGVDPLPGGPEGDDWTEGRSDLDVPHRVAVGWNLKMPVLQGIEFGGTYRFRSGLPFTPGFRPGVDPNGDGIWGNDPAFVPAVAEVDDLVGEWECLEDQIGEFAERNACRAPGIHGLDLRLSVGLLRVGDGVAELVVDALNLVESEQGIRDQALLLVDSQGELVTDETSASVTVPLRVNPDFGRLILAQTPGRWFRIGFRIRY